MSVVMNLCIPYNIGNFVTRATISLSGRVLLRGASSCFKHTVSQVIDASLERKERNTSRGKVKC